MLQGFLRKERVAGPNRRTGQMQESSPDPNSPTCRGRPAGGQIRTLPLNRGGRLGRSRDRKALIRDRNRSRNFAGFLVQAVSRDSQSDRPTLDRFIAVEPRDKRARRRVRKTVIGKSDATATARPKPTAFSCEGYRTAASMRMTCCNIDEI